MKYYQVEAKCGHVGRNNYILKKFYVCAINGKEAASRVRKFPRVKHHHKDAIRNVVEIEYEQYMNGLNERSLDPYFLVRNSSEQKEYAETINGQIVRENNDETYKKPTHDRRKIIQKMLIRDWKSGRRYFYE